MGNSYNALIVVRPKTSLTTLCAQTQTKKSLENVAKQRFPNFSWFVFSVIAALAQMALTSSIKQKELRHFVSQLFFVEAGDSLTPVKTSFLYQLGTHDRKKYLRYGKINIRVNILNQTETLF